MSGIPIRIHILVDVAGTTIMRDVTVQTGRDDKALNRSWLPVELGEWVIKDSKGCYPCKADIFEATYEPVEETG